MFDRLKLCGQKISNANGQIAVISWQPARMLPRSEFKIKKNIGKEKNIRKKILEKILTIFFFNFSGII